MVILGFYSGFIGLYGGFRVLWWFCMSSGWFGGWLSDVFWQFYVVLLSFA